MNLDHMISQHCYAYRDPPFKLRSGQMSNHYVNLRPLTLSPIPLQHLASAAWRRMLEVWPADLSDMSEPAVAGVVVGGCALATAISLLSVRTEAGPSADAIFVRPAPKTHGAGAGKRVELPLRFERHNPVVVVEDVVTTGGSSIEAAEALRAEGCPRVLGILAIVDRREEQTDRLGEWPFASVTTLDRIIKAHQAHEAVIRRWHADAKASGKGVYFPLGEPKEDGDVPDEPR